MAVRAIYGIQHNVRNLPRSRQFYESLGLVVEPGFELAPGAAPPDLSGLEQAMGVPPSELGDSVLLTFPNEPFAHVQLQSWRDGPVEGGWPPRFHQLGARCLSLLVDDLDEEIELLAKRDTPALLGPLTYDRAWGPTRVAYSKDPDGNLFDLRQIDYHPGWETDRRSVVRAPKSFLHFELNTENFSELCDFYEGFGFEWDVDPSKPRDRAPEMGDMAGDMERAFGFRLGESSRGVALLRLPQDHSNMHLEIMGFAPGSLHDPGPVPRWNQKGIMRFCFKVEDADGHLDELKRRGVKIFLENQRMCLPWGDSLWFFFADPDGHILCFEEWFPARYWGERW